MLLLLTHWGRHCQLKQAAMLMACSHQWWVCRPSRCSPLKGKLNPPLEANMAEHPFHLPQQAHTLLAE